MTFYHSRNKNIKKKILTYIFLFHFKTDIQIFLGPPGAAGVREPTISKPENEDERANTYGQQIDILRGYHYINP